MIQQKKLSLNDMEYDKWLPKEQEFITSKKNANHLCHGKEGIKTLYTKALDQKVTSQT